MLSPRELDALADAISERVAARLSSSGRPVDAMLDVQGTADLLGLSQPTIQRLVRAGGVPSRKIGRSRRFVATEPLNTKGAIMASNHHNAPPCNTQEKFITPPSEDEAIRFLIAEIQLARLATESRERYAVFGCECPVCREIRASDGPECGSLAWRAQR